VPEAGTVHVGHHAHGIAFVDMRGEHDLSTAPELTKALEHAAAHSNVLVDLSDCTFIDSTVIQTMVATARVVQGRNERFVLVIPPEQQQITRIAEMTHLAEIVPLYTARSAALTDLEAFNNPGSPERSM
jgi:anti-anti-sigma factor